MTDERLPLLIFPQPSLSARQVGTSNPPTLRLPSYERQAQRLAPKFERLQTAFEQRRVEIQATTPNADPDLVVVLETVGAVSDFASTVERIPGLEWLFGAIERDLEPDEDFYDGADPDRQLGGRLFLLGSNRQALAQVVQLWNRYIEDPQSSLGPGLSAWKSVFKHLKDVRFWGPRDRVGDDIVRYWEERLLGDPATLRFEVEAWCSRTPRKNVEAAAQVRALVSELGGTVLDECLNSDIAYHAFLVEMPAASVREMVSQTPPGLVISEHVMFFRPRGQAFAWDAQIPGQVPDVAVAATAPTGAPAVAIFDGLPLENHARLAGRLVVDDPDSWAANYPARDRNHGTAMASLVVWGELSSSATALSRPVYVRPILFPETDSSANPRPESTPDDQLL